MEEDRKGRGRKKSPLFFNIIAEAKIELNFRKVSIKAQIILTEISFAMSSLSKT